MGGRASRNKGARAQTEAGNLLTERDWAVHPISAGVSAADLLAIDPGGVAWAVEVKKCRSITVTHRDQAIRQARAARGGVRWMLMSHIHGTSYWLVQRQGEAPTIWQSRQQVEGDA